MRLFVLSFAALIAFPEGRSLLERTFADWSVVIAQPHNLWMLLSLTVLFGMFCFLLHGHILPQVASNSKSTASPSTSASASASTLVKSKANESKGSEKNEGNEEIKTKQSSSSERNNDSSVNEFKGDDSEPSSMQLEYTPEEKFALTNLAESKRKHRQNQEQEQEQEQKPWTAMLRMLAVLAGLAFMAASYILFFSETHRFRRVQPTEAMHTISNSLSSSVSMTQSSVLQRVTLVQLTAIVVLGLSTLYLFGFSGVSFVISEGEREREAKSALKIGQSDKVGKAGQQKTVIAASTTATNTTAATLPEIHPRESICAAIVCVELAFVLYSATSRLLTFMRNPHYIDPTGLFWGLGWTAMGQVFVVTYYFAMRILKSETATIQNRPVPYLDGGFLAELKEHLGQPESFLLMGSYLSLTWMLGLMPPSYYVYEPAISIPKVMMQLVISDFFTFVNHITEHRLAPLYVVAHKPHHRFINPKIFDAFNGSLPDTMILILIPLYATANICTNCYNWDYVAFGATYSSYLMLIHCEWSHPLDGLFNWLGIYIAKDHHVHHAAFNYNYAHFFTCWDKICGTYKEPASLKVIRDYKRDHSLQQSTETAHVNS